jgi:hypothetical protein
MFFPRFEETGWYIEEPEPAGIADRAMAAAFVRSRPCWPTN